MKDVMTALLNWLLAQASVAALIDTRGYVNRLPRAVIEAEDTFHPSKMLVLRQSGGAGKSDTMVTDDPTITVLCYGESDFEADRVRRAVWALFVALSRVTQDDVLIYHVNPAGGALPLVDPDIVWPAVSQNFSLKAAVL